MFDYKGSLIIDYTLKAITGLRIGGSKEQFEIGGVDNPVIKLEVEIPDFYEVNSKKFPLPAGVPYIPGSSLKGKIRSLLEWCLGNVVAKINEVKNNNKIEEKKKVEEAGKACSCGQCSICKIFGTGNPETIKELAAKENGLEKIPGPPRLKVFDAYLSYDSFKRLKDTLGENIFTEIKTENQINRLTSRANPRKVERVPAGTEFEGRMVFDFYKDEDKDLVKVVFQGMKMLEDNYLGGYGSRGSGRVKFTSISLIWRSKGYYLGEEKEIEIATNLSNVDEAIKEISKFFNSQKK